MSSKSSTRDRVCSAAMRRALLLPLVLLALVLVACASPLDAMVVELNVARVALDSGNTVLAEQHRRDRDRAVEEAANADAAKRATLAVHAGYAPIWNAYGLARLAWVAAATGLRAALLLEKVGGKPDEAKIRAKVVDAAMALEGFSAAATAPRLMPPPTAP